MSSFSIFDIAGSGMSAESVRLNTVASNLANADSVSGDPTQVYQAKHPVFQTVQALGGGAASQTADQASALPHAHQAPTVRVGLLGCGNVGGALAEILLTRSEDVAARTGIRLELVGIAVANPERARRRVRPYRQGGCRLSSAS